MSLLQVSYNCSIDESKISKIEHGKFNITLSTIVELAKGLEVHPSKLFDYFLEKVKPMDNKETNISELSDKVLKGLKKAIRKLVETSAANNKELIIGDKYGNVKSVPAKKLL